MKKVVARQVIHPPHGVLELVECTASDLQVVNSARVSLGNHVEILEEKDEGLIKFLMREKHGTPFEHNVFIWRVKAPIFVFREWHRHRIGWSYNEMSGRYTQLRPEFYVPSADHIRHQKGKPGDYTYETAEPQLAESVRGMLSASYHMDYGRYEGMLSRGIAKEVARLCLPVATYSEMYATCNARSLMAFLELRAAPTAMREIRDYAEAMLRIFTEEMPMTANAFWESRRAP